MPLGLGSGLWACILPIDETNLATNCSYEFGTAGVSVIQGATLGTSAAEQAYGAWSLQVTPSSNGTSGALLGTVTTGNGTAYSVSVWANVAAGVPMRLGIGDNAGLNLTSGTVTFTGGGTWQWYACGTVEAAQGTRGIVIQKTSGVSVAPFYVDGLKISPWADGTLRTTTYFDGDTGGGTWQGQAHQSPSFRPGQYRGGGSIVALSDLGLQVDQMIGVGVMPFENSVQSFAVTDGAQFQRSRAAARKFSLTAAPLSGTTTADFHVTRRTLFDALKPDLVTPQQPVRFFYVGGQGTVQLDAYYDGGLELGNMDGPMAENAALSFLAPDPYWYSPTQQGTRLGPRTSLGSVNFLVRRDARGKWGTMGLTAGTTIQAGVAGQNLAVNDMLINAGGTLVFAGYFGSVGGTVGYGLGLYYPQTNTFGTLVGGTVGTSAQSNNLANVYSLVQTPAGTLFFAGDFRRVAGTVSTCLAQYANGAFGTLLGGTVDNIIQRLLYNPFGTLFMGGALATAGGTTAKGLAQHANGAFGTLNQQGGTLDAGVWALAWGLDNKTLYVGGNFGSAGGTRAAQVAQISNGSWGTMSTGASGGGAAGTYVYDLATKLDGRIFASGDFRTMGLSTVNNAAEWNGVQWQPDGIGVQGLTFRSYVRPDNSVLVTGSFQAAGSVNIPDGVAIYNGAAWLPLDIDLPTQGVQCAVQAADTTLYLGGIFQGMSNAASVGTIVNGGRAIAYPTLRLRNLSTGTARLYQLLNTTTGDGIYFNYTLLPSESAVLTLQPGARSFQSSMRGNIFSLIQPGSNLASFNLLPGANLISFLSDNDSLEASFFWQPRGHAIDSGTVFT